MKNGNQNFSGIPKNRKAFSIFFYYASSATNANNKKDALVKVKFFTTPKIYRPHLSGQTLLKALSLNLCRFQTLNRIAFKNAPINSNLKIVFKNGVTS